MDVVLCTDEGGHVGPQVEAKPLGKREGGWGLARVVRRVSRPAHCCLT